MPRKDDILKQLTRHLGGKPVEIAEVDENSFGVKLANGTWLLVTASPMDDFDDTE